MKKIGFFILTLCCCRSYSQTQEVTQAPQKIFVRLYNSTGDKIGKGFLLYGTDSSMAITKNHKQHNFSISEISFVKTRRSGGHSILIGTAIGIVTSAVLFTASAGTSNEDDGTSFGLGMAGLMAPIAGAAGGSVAAAVRKHEIIHIDGSVEKWKEARKKILIIR